MKRLCQTGCEYRSVRNQDTDVARAVVGLRVFLSLPALLIYSESMTPNSKASPAYGIRVRSVLPKVEGYLDDRQRETTLARTLRAAGNECDPQKLHKLVVEINRLLEESDSCSAEYFRD